MPLHPMLWYPSSVLTCNFWLSSSTRSCSFASWILYVAGRSGDMPSVRQASFFVRPLCQGFRRQRRSPTAKPRRPASSCRWAGFRLSSWERLVPRQPGRELPELLGSQTDRPAELAQRVPAQTGRPGGLFAGTAGTSNGSLCGGCGRAQSSNEALNTTKDNSARVTRRGIKFTSGKNYCLLFNLFVALAYAAGFHFVCRPRLRYGLQKTAAGFQLRTSRCRRG